MFIWGVNRRVNSQSRERREKKKKKSRSQRRPRLSQSNEIIKNFDFFLFFIYFRPPARHPPPRPPSAPARDESHVALHGDVGHSRWRGEQTGCYFWWLWLPLFCRQECRKRVKCFFNLHRRPLQNRRKNTASALCCLTLSKLLIKQRNIEGTEWK